MYLEFPIPRAIRKVFIGHDY